MDHFLPLRNPMYIHTTYLEVAEMYAIMVKRSPRLR